MSNAAMAICGRCSMSDPYLPPRDSSEIQRSQHAAILRALRYGPKSSKQLVVRPEVLRALAAEGSIALDPDRWPDEYVPGNPLVARLPGDDRDWEGWATWNV